MSRLTPRPRSCTPHAVGLRTIFHLWRNSRMSFPLNYVSQPRYPQSPGFFGLSSFLSIWSLIGVYPRCWCGSDLSVSLLHLQRGFSTPLDCFPPWCLPDRTPPSSVVLMCRCWFPSLESLSLQSRRWESTFVLGPLRRTSSVGGGHILSSTLPTPYLDSQLSGS